MAPRLWPSGLIPDKALAGGGRRCKDSRLRRFRAGGVRQGGGDGGEGGLGGGAGGGEGGLGGGAGGAGGAGGGESENYNSLIKQRFPNRIISVQNRKRLPLLSPDGHRRAPDR